MRWLGIVATLALALPTVLAAPVQGTLVLQGLRLDGLAHTQLHLHALYTNDTAGIRSFELDAERVELRIWRAEDVEARSTEPKVALRVDNREEFRVLTRVRILLDAGDHAGWLGVRWSSDAEATLDAGAAVEHRPYSEIGQTENRVPDADAPSKRYFMEPLRAPHLLVTRAHGLRIDGGAALRVSGLDLVLESGGNTTRLETGITRDETPVGRTQAVWATLTFTNGTLRATGLGAAQAQAYAAVVAWTGAATLLAPEGALHERDRTWLADAGDEVVTGTFRATLQPQGDGIHAQLAGDLATATMPAAAAAPAPARLASAALPWVVLVAGLVLAAAATHRVAKRRRAQPGPEELLDLALHASEAGDHERALAWVARARARAPDSERLVLEEAGILAAAGDDDRALAQYRRLAETTRNGEACWLLARGLARRGAHPDDVAPWIVRAIERDPMLVMEVEEDEVLAAHARRGDVRTAMDAARGRLS